MIEIKTIYSLAEAVALLRAVGLNPIEREILIYSANESWPACKWMIEAGGKWYDVETVFREVMENRLKEILNAGINRDKVIQTFNN